METFLQIARTQKVSFLRGSVRNLMVHFLSAEQTPAVLCLSQHLNHLALNTTTHIPVCGQVLAMLKSLRALLILCPPPTQLRDEFAILVEDPRFVIMGIAYWAHDWQAGILTGVDSWTRADEFIAKRISGEINRRRFFFGEEEKQA
ncbi:hypothetical protein C8R44DRAFT_882462 [Mycena epipterygia]|nr:hypothetical protein C8R44DRAFT_882462 [Mycena epipterygia]